MPRRKCDLFPLRLLPMLGLGDVQYPSRNIHTTSQPTTNNNRDIKIKRQIHNNIKLGI